jgi:hypothetical protein
MTSPWHHNDHSGHASGGHLSNQAAEQIGGFARSTTDQA